MLLRGALRSVLRDEPDAGGGLLLPHCHFAHTTDHQESALGRTHSTVSTAATSLHNLGLRLSGILQLISD